AEFALWPHPSGWVIGQGIQPANPARARIPAAPRSIEMRSRTRTSVVAAVALLAIVVAPAAGAQSEPSATQRKGGVPVEELIAAVAKRTGKTFIIDPRVQGEAVLIGSDPAKLDYAELLSVLQVHGFAAVARGDVVRV